MVAPTFSAVQVRCLRYAYPIASLRHICHDISISLATIPVRPGPTGRTPSLNTQELIGDVKIPQKQATNT